MTAPTGLTAAVLAAAVFGLSAVLQRIGAAGPIRWRRGRRPVGRVGHRPAFAVGVVLDGVGLALSLVAVRDLPVHVVEAVLASSVAISAVLSALVLGERLDRTRWAAVAVLTSALVVIGTTGVDAEAPTVRGLLAAAPVVALAVCAAAAWVLRHRVLVLPPVATGALSGASFGMVTLSGRLAHDLSLPIAPGDVLFVVSVAGWSALGLALFWAGLRRGAVAPVVVGQTLGETLVPSLLAAAMGERWSEGSPGATLVAFAVAIGCAVVIAGWDAEEREAGRTASRSPADVTPGLRPAPAATPALAAARPGPTVSRRVG